MKNFPWGWLAVKKEWKKKGLISDLELSFNGQHNGIKHQSIWRFVQNLKDFYLILLHQKYYLNNQCILLSDNLWWNPSLTDARTRAKKLVLTSNCPLLSHEDCSPGLFKSYLQDQQLTPCVTLQLRANGRHTVSSTVMKIFLSPEIPSDLKRSIYN